MKVLWIVNFSMPAVQREHQLPVPQSGWWLDTISQKLKTLPDTQLYVLSLVQGLGEGFSGEIDGIYHQVLPIGYKDRQIYPSREFAAKMHRLLEKIRPDVIHLQGSEFAIGIPFLLQRKIPVVLSIQGLISEIVKKDYSYPDLQFGFSFIDCMVEKIRHWKNKKRAKSEIWQLKHADYIIGRTLWDRTHTYFYNKKATYFYLQECIRESFSQNSWELSKTEPYTVFCAGGLASPLKGFHNIVAAASLLKEEFPQLKLKVCGSFRKNEKVGYHRYLIKWIHKLGMEEHIEFLGPLDEQAMCEAFLQSRMYVMGSSIENSANTLGEAMCLGVPAVVPFVGGIPSLATDEKEALFYRFSDIEALAFQMRRLLLNPSFAESLGQNARERAKKQYATENSAENLLKIYHTVLEQNKKK